MSRVFLKTFDSDLESPDLIISLKNNCINPLSTVTLPLMNGPYPCGKTHFLTCGFIKIQLERRNFDQK